MTVASTQVDSGNCGRPDAALPSVVPPSNERLDRSVRSRRVLMIAAAFPPTGGPGVQRATKFAKYLPRFGWQPTVWSLAQMENLPRDDSLLNDLPVDLSIVRSLCPPGGRLQILPDGIASGMTDTTPSEGWWRRLLDWRHDRRFPDPQISWARASIKPLLLLHEHESFDAVWTTFSPASNHWIGLQLRLRAGLAWIADFRDLWTDDYRYEESSQRRRTADRALEDEILRYADCVVGVTAAQTSILAARVDGQPTKFHTITNGYDPDDFAARVADIASSTTPNNLRSSTESNPEGISARRAVRIAYVGRLDARRCPEALIAALRSLRERLAPQGKNVVFRVVGHIADATCQRFVCAGVPFEYTGYVTHATAIREMQQADLLVACVPQLPKADSTIPAKLFEYLATNRPILLIGPPDGAAARLVRSFDATLVVPADIEAVASAISQLLSVTYAAGRKPHSKRDLTGFDRRSQASTLASCLDDLVMSDDASGCQSRGEVNAGVVQG